MDNVEWHPFFYNGLETNIEVTRCGRVRRVFKDWMKINRSIKEVDVANIVSVQGYCGISVRIKNFKKTSTVYVHQMVASVYLDHNINGQAFVIDHIDSNKKNNHVDNLRIFTNRENTSKERTIRSGLPANVSYCNWKKDKKKYRVLLFIKDRNKSFGYYYDVEEASNVAKDALKSLNQFLKDTDNKGDQNEWYRSYYKKPKKSGLPIGVTFAAKTKSFRAKIHINNHAIRLGNYKRSEDAHKAYKEAKSSLDKWLSENKDPNDWITEYKNKVKNESEYRKQLNKSVEVTEGKPSNIGEQLAIQFN